MKNITVSVDDETYRRARVKAAQADTSVSALVRKFLTDLTVESVETREERFARMVREEQKLRETIINFDANDRLSRDELHERRAG